MLGLNKEEGHELQCPKCEYKWKTKSKLFWVSCPSCLHKVKQAEVRDK